MLDEVNPTSVLSYNDIPIVQEPDYENCLDLICVAPPCEQVIFLSDKNYITSAIRKSKSW